jgi:hypothetical protein
MCRSGEGIKYKKKNKGISLERKRMGRIWLNVGTIS